MNAPRPIVSRRPSAWARLSMSLAATLALLPLVVLGSCASAKGESYFKPGFEPRNVRRLAVVDGKDKAFVDETRQAILDSFQLQFFKKGWPVVERSNIARAVDELNFQNADYTRDTDRLALGNMLNADALLIVNLASTGKEVSMTAKMIQVDTGDILWMGTGDGKLNKGLGALTGAILGAAAGAAAGDGDGAVIGGVLGGSVGYMLGPSELESAKDVVDAVCESLPMLL